MSSLLSTVKSLFTPDTPPPLDLAARKRVALDTVNRTPQITQKYAHLGASLSSSFIDCQLPPLSPPSTTTPTKYTIVNSDAYTAARSLLTHHPEAIGKVAVLNLASDQHPGGGWLSSLSRTQEEALCYSSTLYPTLLPSYYPWPNTGPGCVAGIYSPGIVVFKDDLDHWCLDLGEEEVRVVAVLTVAAPRGPKTRRGEDGEEAIRDEKVAEELRGKIRLVYRMAAGNGKEYIVLGAMGCGAYACPPTQVAREMRAILLEDEFKAAFREVVFAVYSKPGNGGTNYEVFERVLRDIL